MNVFCLYSWEAGIPSMHQIIFFFALGIPWKCHTVFSRIPSYSLYGRLVKKAPITFLSLEIFLSYFHPSISIFLWWILRSHLTIFWSVSEVWSYLISRTNYCLSRAGHHSWNTIVQLSENFFSQYFVPSCRNLTEMKPTKFVA